MSGFLPNINVLPLAPASVADATINPNSKVGKLIPTLTIDGYTTDTSVSPTSKLGLLDSTLTSDGHATDATPDPASTAGRIISGTGTLYIGQSGDSRVTGSTPSPGGSRIAMFARLRRRRGNVVAWGPVIQGRPSSLSLGDLRCAGYPGETIAQLTARYQAAGSVYVYAATSATPSILFHKMGTNDAAAGTSSASMLTLLTTFCEAVKTLFPTTYHVLETIPHLYAPVAPPGGLSAANANIDAYNAGLAAVAAAAGAKFSWIDSGGTLPQSMIYATDGTHDTPEGAATVGEIEAAEVERIFPLAVGPAMPRGFSQRVAASSVALLTPTTDSVAITSPGFELAASNVAICAELRITDLSASSGTLAIAQCTPSGQNYSHGWLLAYDTAASSLVLYLKSLGSAVTAGLPSDAIGRPLYVCAHADRVTGVAQILIAYVPSGGSDVVVGCIGQATGVTAWAAGDASGILTVGKDASFNGFGGIVRRVEFAKGASVPGVDGIRAAFEAWVYEGRQIPGTAETLPMSEGIGTTCTSGNAVAGTLTGGWSSAGTIAWPSEEQGGSSILLVDGATEWDFGSDRRVRAVFDASQGVIRAAGAVSQWSSAIGDLTGVQATGAKKPTYNATGINGRPSIDFDGTQTFLSIDKFGSALGTEAIAPQCDQLFVAVLKPAGSFATGRYLLDVATGRTICAVNDSSLGNHIGYYGAGWSAAGGQVATTNVQILAWEYRAGLGSRIFLNGVQIGSTDPSGAVATALGSTSALGSNNGGSSSFYQGSVGAIAIAAGRIDDALRTRITRKLGALYGVPVTT